MALARIPDRRADKFFELARQSIARVEPAYRRGQEKRNLVMSLSETGRLDDAWKVLETVWEWDVYSEWAALAAHLSERGDERADMALANALRVARRITNDSTRDEALVELATALADQHRFAMMEDVAMQVNDRRRRSAILSAVAGALHAAKLAHSKELFALAERTAREEWSNYQQGEALSALVVALSDASEFEDALRIVATIASDTHRIAALSDLAARLALAGDPRGAALFDQALGVASGDGVPEEWPEIDDLRRKAQELDRIEDPGAAALWRQANERSGSLWTSWTWEKPEYRAESLLKIAANLSHAQDPRWKEAFEIARAEAKKIPYQRTRDETFLTFITAMLAVNRLDAARTILDDLRGETERLKGIRLLVKAFAETRQADAARGVASLVSSDYYRREVIRQVAVAFAKANQMAKAIEILEEATLDNFIEAIGETHAAWVDPPPGAIIASLRAAISVAAWVRSDWSETGALLQA